MSKAALSEHVSVHGRFARSVRLDRDADEAAQLDGYLPTGRSLEVVRRLARGMAEPGGARAFSITGPYGSGKSSLALFIDALLGNRRTKAYRAAASLLTETDPELLDLLEDARASMSAPSAGFIRAVITAPQREPITTTVLRALARGGERAGSRIYTKSVRSQVEGALRRAKDSDQAPPSYDEVRQLMSQFAQKRPVLLVIDEFGKNLEAYADGGREGDLYLLQELAEWTSGADSLPLVVMTIQHLAFEAYAEGTSTAQRREWAKVQGRFEDIPYVDSPGATRTLIARAIQHEEDDAFVRFRDVVAEEETDRALGYGLAQVANVELIRSCYPLHPTTLLVLPVLCARYGQNERTLFSFLSSKEPHSVMSFMREHHVGEKPTPWVRLDRVYDYFVEAASTFIGASKDARRWIEIETIIRDAQGLSDAQLRVLKAVGVLNLVAAGGPLRASREMVTFALADGRDGTEDADAVTERLDELSSLLTYRDFSGEYRLWHGSDFDLQTALQQARSSVRERPVAEVLSDVHELTPVVAARHSTELNTTRAFWRLFADHATELPSFDGNGGALGGCDGLLLYLVDPEGAHPQVPSSSVSGRPVVAVRPDDDQALRAVLDAGVELAALRQVADDSSLPESDQAARRELDERIAHAHLLLERAVADAFHPSASRWKWLNAPEGWDAPRRGGLGTGFLSSVFDEVFRYSPYVANETINRSELTSAGSRARRVLLEAALDPRNQTRPRLGLEGEGADVAMYEAVLFDAHLHMPGIGFVRPEEDTTWGLAWDALTERLRSVADSTGGDGRVAVDQLLRVLEAPPFGLKTGTATVFLTVWLIVNARNIAVYEHGTFKPRLDAPLSERMVRNPGNFTVKYLAAATPKRTELIERLHAVLTDVLADGPLAASAATPSVLSNVRLLVGLMQANPQRFVRSTQKFQRLWSNSLSDGRAARAARVRDVLVEARQPDDLLFVDLPHAVFGEPRPIEPGQPSAAGMRKADFDEYLRHLRDALVIIRDAYKKLTGHVVDELNRAVAPHDLDELASSLAGVETLSREVHAFVERVRQYEMYTSREDWLEALTQTVTGTALSDWTDRDFQRHLALLSRVAADVRRVGRVARYENETLGAGSGEYSAYPVTLPGGVDHVGLLWSDDEEAIADVVGKAVASVGDERRAKEGLLAWLIRDLVGDDPPDSATGGRGDSGHRTIPTNEGRTSHG